MTSRSAGRDLLHDILLEAGFALQALDEGRDDLARVHLDRLLRAGYRLPATAELPGLPRTAARAHVQILEDLGGSFEAARRTIDDLMRRVAERLAALP